MPTDAHEALVKVLKAAPSVLQAAEVKGGYDTPVSASASDEQRIDAASRCRVDVVMQQLTCSDCCIRARLVDVYCRAAAAGDALQ